MSIIAAICFHFNGWENGKYNISSEEQFRKKQEEQYIFLFYIWNYSFFQKF
jgi:inorganic pyrophosphatase